MEEKKAKDAPMKYNNNEKYVKEEDVKQEITEPKIEYSDK